MSCLITCDCGARLRAEEEPAVLEAMRRHLEDAHPLVAGGPSADDLLALVEHDDD